MTDPGPTIAARIADHFEAIGKDNVRAAEIYADSIVLEYVNSGERIHGKANIIASRQAYPGRPAFFEIRRSGGTSELQVVELTQHIEGDLPHPVVAVLDFEREGVSASVSTSPSHGSRPPIAHSGPSRAPREPQPRAIRWPGICPTTNRARMVTR